MRGYIVAEIVDLELLSLLLQIWWLELEIVFFPGCSTTRVIRLPNEPLWGPLSRSITQRLTKGIAPMTLASPFV